MRIAIAIALTFAAVANGETLVLRGVTMGTTYQVKLVSQLDSVDQKALHEEIEDTLVEIDRQMSTYRPDSELSGFNKAPAGEWFPVSAATAKVVTAAQHISDQADGAMDITVGPLVQLWHFGPPKIPDRLAQKQNKFAPPADAEIAVARQRTGYKKLEVRSDPPALQKKAPGLEVDLSSIASGYAIDLLSAIIAKRGIENYMVELGGEVRAAGLREDGQPWRVAVERPSASERELQTSLPLNNASISTAGDYRRFFEHAGKRYSHIIDPATGRPVNHALASVTVVADTCIEADGWDTPLLVLGPQRGFECATKHDIAAMFIERNGKDVVVRETQAWRKRFAGKN